MVDLYFSLYILVLDFREISNILKNIFSPSSIKMFYELFLTWVWGISILVVFVIVLSPKHYSRLVPSLNLACGEIQPGGPPWKK